jgi:phosphatidylserine decarboxylase
MINKGSELGRFEMGSTVILIFQKDMIDLTSFNKEDRIQYGSTIGKLNNNSYQVSARDIKKSA